MKELKQHVAQEVNKLEGQPGAFWSGRFKSKPIDDPEGGQLVRSMVYVDLNPLAAGLCETPEQGRHTSLEARLGLDQPEETLAETGSSQPPDRARIKAANANAHGPRMPMPKRSRGSRWLVGLSCERSTSSASSAPARQVFAGLTLKRYLGLVDAVARLLRSGKTSLNRRMAPILERLGLSAEELEAGFAKMAHGSPHF